jgi:hypothetical protein
MSPITRYRKQAAQAERLAEVMHQPDVIETLRTAAQEYDALARGLEDGTVCEIKADPPATVIIDRRLKRRSA